MLGTLIPAVVLADVAFAALTPGQVQAESEEGEELQAVCAPVSIR